jgi:hypothetical protein
MTKAIFSGVRRAWQVLTIGGFCLLGCADVQENEEPYDDVEEVDLDSISQAVVNGWTAWVSEENPPVTCSQTSLVTQAACSGGYCDNTRFFCSPQTGLTRGTSYWTPYFSEEGGGSRTCTGANEWVTGMACRGSSCDNVSLQCTAMTGSNAGNCFWSGLYSEEQGTAFFPAGYFLRGAKCNGSRCDNKQYFLCQR